MATHIHVHYSSIRDANTAHDPKNGQFTTGQAVAHQKNLKAGWTHHKEHKGSHYYTHPSAPSVYHVVHPDQNTEIIHRGKAPFATKEEKENFKNHRALQKRERELKRIM